MHVTVLDVGQADSAVIDLPRGYFGLVDFGGAAAARRVVVPQIQSRLDAGKRFLFAAATHWDADHVGGLVPVFNIGEPKYFLESAVPLDLFEAWVASDQDQPALRAIQRCRASGTQQIRCAAGLQIHWREMPDVRIIPLSPDGHVESDLRGLLERHVPESRASLSTALRRLRNRSSLALYMEHESSSAVMLGEVEADQVDFMAEVICERIAKSYRVPRFVRLPHHGSLANNPEELFATFASAGTLMAVSAGGRYGHPDAIVMHRVRSAQAIPVCTTLGHPCHLIIRDGMPTDLVSWRESQSNLHTVPPNRQPCYGSIRVSIGRNGVKANFASVQRSCPFGGPRKKRLSI